MKECECGVNCACHERNGGTCNTMRIGKVLNWELLQVALWDEHVSWTREVVIAILHKLPSLDAAVNRLLTNQKQIAQTFRGKYGDATSRAVHDLLKEHIIIAKNLVEALVAGRGKDVSRLTQTWSQNGQQIADALYNLNPSLATQAEWRKHMQDHLDITTREIIAYQTMRYEDSQVAYVNALNQARVMAYMIARLIM